MSEQETIVLDAETAFKALFNYAPVGIVFLNPNGDIEFANPFAEKLFEYGFAELVHTPLNFLIPEVFKENHSSHFDLYALKKDGTQFRVIVDFGYYRLGTIMFTVAFITDRTEIDVHQRELYDEVEEQKARFQLALKREKKARQMKSRFASMASHEFRTLLSTILSSISLIETYNNREEEEIKMKHIKRIRTSVLHLTDIIDDLLSIDKIQESNIIAIQAPYDFKEFVTEIVEEIVDISKSGPGIILSYTGAKQVSQDKKILRSVLLNLLSNALKYSADNTSVHLAIHVAEERVFIEVKNEGIGIPEEEKEKIFRTFYRAENVGDVDGTGLGLSIAKYYTDLLKGNIGFVSEAGKETVFTVELPSNTYN